MIYFGSGWKEVTFDLRIASVWYRRGAHHRAKTNLSTVYVLIHVHKGCRALNGTISPVDSMGCGSPLMYDLDRAQHRSNPVKFYSPTVLLGDCTSWARVRLVSTCVEDVCRATLKLSNSISTVVFTLLRTNFSATCVFHLLPSLCHRDNPCHSSPQRLETMYRSLLPLDSLPVPLIISFTHLNTAKINSPDP